MASDIKVKFNEQSQEFDFEYNNGDLVREDGLETAVLISLFTDRRADADDSLINAGEYRGFWGDLIGNEGILGSRLWLIKGQKSTQKNVNLAKEYITEALQWMIDDEVVAKIDIETAAMGFPENKTLAAKILLYYNDENVESIVFKDLWEAQISNG